MWGPKLGVVVALVALAGCGGDEPEVQVDGSLSAEVQASLDAGTEAYRTGDYDRALEAYRKAAEEAPHAAAGWFGVAMAERALGNEAGYTEAMKQAQGLAPGVTMSHPEPGEGMPAMADHPPVGTSPDGKASPHGPMPSGMGSPHGAAASAGAGAAAAPE